MANDGNSSMMQFVSDPSSRALHVLDLTQAQAYNANLNSLLHEYKSAHKSACRNLANVSLNS